jgi:apolipoprotein N-acyltransferase
MLTRLAALAAGAACVFGFAPFAVPLVTLASLSLVFYLWMHASSPRAAAGIGFAFGVGLFGVGASWIYIALETFGGMPAPVAMVATAVYVAYLALWPSLAGWIAVRVTPADSTARLLAAAAAFTLAEWLRGWALLGVTWFSIGNAELLPEGGLPLAGYAPTGGVFLVTLAVALCAAAIAGIIAAVTHAKLRHAVAWLALIAVLVVAGELQLRVPWTAAQGAPVAVSLVQGNVSQAEKFDPAFQPRNYERYDNLVRQSKGRIVVLPESAYPQFADEIPGSVFLRLTAAARARDGGILVGLFVAEPPLKAGEGERIYNSVVSLGEPPPQLYRKHHLVPFGESLPLKAVTGWFINKVLAIPLADQAAGPAGQPPFEIAGQRIAVNICYEDVFGAELIAAARSATLLVNVTNDAWYGRSIAARQHNQIAAMRALETGRPMLRATNTGITSAIAHDGRVLAELPWFTTGILEIEIAGRSGDTPYLRFGDWPAVAAALALVIAAALLGRRRVR